MKTENHLLKATVKDQDAKIKALQQLLDNSNIRQQLGEKEPLETFRKLLNIESTVTAASSGKKSLELTNGEAESSTDREDKFTENQKHTLSNTNPPTREGKFALNDLGQRVKGNSTKQRADTEESREEVSNYVPSFTPTNATTISGIPLLSLPPPAAISRSLYSMRATAADYQPFSSATSPGKKPKTASPSRRQRWGERKIKTTIRD